MNEKLQPSTTYRAVLGKVLELKRNALGLNQGEFAQRLGMSQSAWSRVETGQSNLSVEELVIAARELRTRPEDILENVHRSITQLQKRGVRVLMQVGKTDDDTATAAFVGGAALAALVVAILAAGKK